MYQFNKTRKIYSKYAKQQSDICDFCHPHTNTKRVVTENKHALVIENRVHYDLWELRRVTDHLLVIPRRHVHHLNELNSAERADIMDFIAEYEGVKHYEVYARSPSSVTRSVGHQHTHLIKADNKPKRGLVFLRKPYILWRIP